MLFPGFGAVEGRRQSFSDVAFAFAALGRLPPVGRDHFPPEFGGAFQGPLLSVCPRQYLFLYLVSVVVVQYVRSFSDALGTGAEFHKSCILM